MAIYAKKGDKGKTSLYKKGEQVSKSTLRISAIGTVDELNSALGVCISFSEDKALIRHLVNVQRDLFVVGSILAGANLRFHKSKTIKLEKVIDKLEGSLPVLKNFILPGGSELAARLHVCRAVCRRAERACVRAGKKSKVNSLAVVYLNRLSSFFFGLALLANRRAGVSETEWK